MTLYIFDIDGTIADTSEKGYSTAEPDEAMIALVNMLYFEGNEIWIITARGTTSNVDYKSLTEKQLKVWGVNYHKLFFGKIVSDEVITPERFLNEI